MLLRLPALFWIIGFGLALAPAFALAHPGLDELEAAVAESVRAEPESPLRYLEQGHVFRLAKKWDIALSAIQHAADHGAEPGAVEAARGQIFLDAQWPHMAIFHFDRALALEPSAGQLLVARGRAWRLLGNHSQAAVDIGEGVNALREPRPEHFFEWRDAQLATGNFGAAIAALDEGVRRLGALPSLELAALDLEEEHGALDAALRRSAKMLERNPNNAAWLARRGDLLARQGNLAEAQQVYRQALAQIDNRPPHRRGKRMAALQHDLLAKLSDNNGGQK